MGMFKEFWEEEDGIATVEILLILAVLIIIAIIFRTAIIKWVKNILANLFPQEADITDKPPIESGT